MAGKVVPWLTYFLKSAAVMSALLHIDCSATSRMARAEVKQVQGTLCFAIPENDETRKGVPLYSVTVSETESTTEESLPELVWHVVTFPYAQPIKLMPHQCISYGRLLPGTLLKASRELLPFRVYSVHLNARPAATDLMGYDAVFCIVPGTDGSFTVELPGQGVREAACHR